MLFLPSPNISHFSKKPRFLSVGNVSETKLLEPRVTAQGPQALSRPQGLCTCTRMYVHTQTHTKPHMCTSQIMTSHGPSPQGLFLPCLGCACIPSSNNMDRSSHCNPVIYPQCLQSCFAHCTAREKHYSECVFTFPHPSPQTVGRTDGIQISTEPHRNLH